ncbi:MAG: BatA and WFA domain-containing protein [Candidatus Poribacteria bacterium]|nr:BatA and WFA domain-containing protein [Candidatus Poribacteria bacterium]
MHFLNGSALYLFAFIPLVASLHFLRLRRNRHVVPSVMFWLEAIEDMKANVPFQRIRKYFPLILQLVFLSLAVVTVARPAFRSYSPLFGQSLLILENSASMQSTESGKSRFDIAKKRALELIDQLDDRGQMMIMDTSRPPHHIRQGFTSDKEKLRRTIHELTPQHTSPEIKLILSSAAAYGKGASTGIFYIGGNAQEIPNPPPRLQKIVVGTPRENVGIVQFNVSRNPIQPRQFQILAGLRNFGSEEWQFRARLDIGGRWYDDERVTLPPGENRSIVFTIDDEGFDGLVVSLNLELKDDLALDNSAWAFLHRREPTRVLLASDRSQPLLSKMLEADANIELEEIGTQDYRGLESQDIAIFDGYAPENLPEANAVFLNPVNGLPFMPVTETTTKPVRVIYQDRVHAIMRDVPLIDLSVRESLVVQLPTWGRSLAETEKGALIWWGEHANRRYVVFAFDAFNLETSRFALLIPSGPILLSRCLEWLTVSNTTVQPDVVKVGTPVKITLSDQEAEEGVTVQLPDGSTTDISSQTSPITFAGTSLVGVYTVSIRERQIGRFAVNLLDSQESGGSSPQSGQERVESDPEGAPLGNQAQEVNREIWKYTACLGIFLLLIEWWVYHRNN